MNVTDGLTELLRIFIWSEFFVRLNFRSIITDCW